MDQWLILGNKMATVSIAGVQKINDAKPSALNQVAGTGVILVLFIHYYSFYYYYLFIYSFFHYNFG